MADEHVSLPPRAPAPAPPPRPPKPPPPPPPPRPPPPPPPPPPTPPAPAPRPAPRPAAAPAPPPPQAVNGEVSPPARGSGELRQLLDWCAGLAVVLACGLGLLLLAYWLAQAVGLRYVGVPLALAAALSLGLFLLMERTF